MTEIDIPDWLIQGIVTVIILPIICFPINAYLSNKVNKNNIHAQGKNAYRNFLINNSKPIEDLFYKLRKYKNDTTFKDFFFIEGIPLGSLLFIFLLTFTVALSKVSKLSEMGFFKYYYNYFYEQKDVDLLGVFLSFDLFILIMIVILGLLLIILYLKRYDDPKLTEEFSLNKISKYIYYSYWFSMGLLIGLNINVLYFTISLGDIIISLIKQLPRFLIVLMIICYIVPFFLSLGIIGILYRETKYFSNGFKQKVTDFYIDDFPNIRIKTNGEDISGKIDDIHNESLIILNEGNKVKAIRWDQITTMEIEKSEENNEDLHEVVKNNKPWWKFW